MIHFLKIWLKVIAIIIGIALAVALLIGVPIFLMAGQLWWYAGGYIFLEITLLIALWNWDSEEQRSAS